jgi:hypothetical protein
MVEPVGHLLRQHGLVRTESPAQELAEPVRLLDRLAAGERGHDRRAGGAKDALDLVEGVLPRQRLEAARAGLAQRRGDAVGGVEVAVREAALVAEPTLVDLGVVAGEDPLDLALACRRADAAADRAGAAGAVGTF